MSALLAQTDVSAFSKESVADASVYPSARVIARKINTELDQAAAVQIWGGGGNGSVNTQLIKTSNEGEARITWSAEGLGVRREAPQNSVASAVKGVVIRVSGDGSVECTVGMGGSDVPIVLPEDIFPATPAYGEAFYLSVSEHGGVRRPVIHRREVRLPANDPIAASLRQLMEISVSAPTRATGLPGVR